VTEHRLLIGGRAVLLVEGPAAWGECSPLPDYPCDPARARAAADEAARGDWPTPRRDSVPVNSLVPAAVAPGPWTAFPAVKVKCGRDRPDVDVARVRRVRELVGPDVAVRVDANGAWDVETATAVLRALAPVGLELAEQPVRSIAELASLRRAVAVPLAADECVRSVADARELRARAAADAVVLKVQPLGGVRAALAVADAAGLPAVVSSMLETSIGLAAGLALACALDDVAYACGLATLDAIAGDVVRTPLAPSGGRLRRPPVLPPVPDPELVARYEVAT
jgi:O-succinylbenzoate synthase